MRNAAGFNVTEAQPLGTGEMTEELSGGVVIAQASVPSSTAEGQTGPRSTNRRGRSGTTRCGVSVNSCGHEEPSSGIGTGINENLKRFLESQVEVLKANLQEKLKASQDHLSRNLNSQLAYMDQKISLKSDRPIIKSLFNQRAFDRIQAYKLFLVDAKFALENGNSDEALSYLDLCLEALTKFQEEISLADRSPAGWKLIERLEEM